MDRREFLKLAGGGLAGLALAGIPLPLEAKGTDKKYNIVILGDTHYDLAPASIYHSHYNEKTEWLNRVQRAEFKRNGEMWADRLPRLIERASRLVDGSTRMVFQMGDLVQGDCGNGDVHRKMLADAMDYIKKRFGSLPFVTVEGNHDNRGTDAMKVYHEYMPERMSQELGKTVTKTTFGFSIGRDAYIFIDFNEPDDAETERLLREYEGARHTFIVSHGPLFPHDGGSPRWFYHGADNDSENSKRRHFRKLFAKCNAIALSGHTHTTDLIDWYGDGGRITQMIMNSVWASDKNSKFSIIAQGAEEYGAELKKRKERDNSVNAEEAIFSEYRPGIREYLHSNAAGSFKLSVGPQKITVDLYAGDSIAVSHHFVLRP